MSSVHSHFLPEEEKQVPHEEVQEIQENENDSVESKDVQMDESEESAESEASEQSEITDDDESSELDETSSEASSIMNDPDIQTWVPVVSSSDDTDGEDSITSPANEFEPIAVPLNSGHGSGQPTKFSSRNRARRSRARDYGSTYARRGRHRQPENEQDWYMLTPFERGVTYNGFARNLVPQKITNHMVDIDGEVLYYVQWQYQRESKLIESCVMLAHRPDMVVNYHEGKVTGKADKKYFLISRDVEHSD